MYNTIILSILILSIRIYNSMYQMIKYNLLNLKHIQGKHTHITAFIQNMLMYVYRYITIGYDIIHCIAFNITEIKKTRNIFNYMHINFNKLIQYIYINNYVYIYICIYIYVCVDIYVHI